MLKKVLLLLLTLCLLPLTVYADASRLHEYVGPCPHQLCNFGVVLENAADAIGEVGKTGEYASAVCEYCEQVYHITLSGDPLRNERNLQEECNHQFRKLDYMLEQGWYPSYTATYEQDGVTYERVSIMHEYRTFYLCVCDYCDTTIRMYEGELTNGRSFENHNYPDLEDVEIHAHDYRNSRHLYFVTCEDCGHTTITSAICAKLDNGLCYEELRDKLEAQGCQHSQKDAEIGALNTCPKCN